MPQIFKPDALISELVKADLPLPVTMMERDNMRQWGLYIKHSPLARAFSKFAESTDRYHQTCGNYDENTDFTALPLATQEEIYSHWATTAAAAYVMMDKLQYKITAKGEEARALDSDIAFALFFVAKLMEGVKSADAALWNARLEQQKNIDLTQPQKTFSALISNMMNRAENNAPHP